ncbi:hypothetical protein BD780_003679 [Clostridium tetanomorphum]|nr:hypothetical protein [Clostridium tetanomorphum]NRS86454.1 hypothetical protein [Clostridium tetanomorphum]NRZ95517.1 hypothetical protein [Clostridium tetanomorphum]SQC00877.1 Uncharacterised protein [Clostridium tetanomorphum]
MEERENKVWKKILLHLIDFYIMEIEKKGRMAVCRKIHFLIYKRIKEGE